MKFLISVDMAKEEAEGAETYDSLLNTPNQIEFHAESEEAALELYGELYEGMKTRAHEREAPAP